VPAWRLGHDGAVDIADLEALGAHAPGSLGQQHGGVRPLELRVGIREMAADIAQRRSAEQGIGDCMQQHVGIRMAEQAQAVRHFDTAENQLAPRNQGMYIPAFTNTKIHKNPCQTFTHKAQAAIKLNTICAARVGHGILPMACPCTLLRA
jgi:hypothetical protein